MKHITPEKDLKSILLSVTKPGRYSGGEYGICLKKDHQAILNIALSYPDLYEIGMSNQAVKLLYNSLNSINGVRCERVFAPAPDFELELRNKNIPLYSLESGIPLHEFDIICFSLGYELTVTNILNILDLGGIAILHKDRSQTDPLIMGGGPGITNPYPFSLFFDSIFLGEADTWLGKTFTKLVELKRAGATKEDIFKQLLLCKSMWSPLKKEPVYRSICMDYYKNSLFSYYPVPNIKTAQDHGVVEIMRGCPHACRFCHAAYYYRPYRVKPINQILKQIDSLIFNCGYRRITLSSLSTGDFPGIATLLRILNKKYQHLGISFSLPSLRIDSVALSIFSELKTVRKSGLTFAVETPLYADQCVLNKLVPYEKTIDILKRAKELGWYQAKFYFMIGLPGYIEKDNAAQIIDYLDNVQKQSNLKISVNLSTFVPKPHTPFQWQEQLEEEKALARIIKIKRALTKKQFKVTYQAPFQSFLEGMISRGDERVGDLVLNAFKMGARLDAWEEYLNRDIWKNVIKRASWNVEKEAYRKRSRNEVLPWQNIKMRTSIKYLKNEHVFALNKRLTASCRKDCYFKCGVCNKNIYVNNDFSEKSVPENKFSGKPDFIKVHEPFHILLSFEKKEKAIFLSHLNIMNIFERALYRAGYIPFMTEGFNPKPKIEFANPLPLGFSSLNEIALCQLLIFNNTESFISGLNKKLPDGILITKAKLLQSYNKGQKKRSLMSVYGGSDYIIKFYFNNLDLTSLKSLKEISNINYIKSTNSVSFRLQLQKEYNVNIRNILNTFIKSKSIFSKCDVKRILTLAISEQGQLIDYFQAYN